MGDAEQHSPVQLSQSYDNIGSPRLRRLWGPITTLPGSSKVMEVRYEATGSLLPQPLLSTPRIGGPLMGPPGEASYSMSTIRRVHAMVLQSSLDLSFGGALERVVTAAKAITNSRHAQIFFLEKNAVQPGGLSGSTSFGLRLKGRGSQDRVFPSQGLAGVCASENLPVISNRPHHDARFDPEIDWAPGSGAKTVACAPMTNLCGKLVGVIEVCNKVQGGYTAEDMHFLDMLARQAAVTFDLCVKNDQRQMQIRKSTTMLKGFVKLAEKASPAELAHKSGLLCKEVCGASQASCFLVQGEDEGLSSWSKESAGKGDVFHQNKVPVKGFLAEVFKGSSPDEQGTNGGFVSQHLGSLYCPIVCGGKTTGVLQARGSRKGHFSDVDQELLKVLGGMVAALQQNLERIGMTAKADSGKPWHSIQQAVGEIDKTMLDGLNCQKTALLFVEQETHCFWTLDPAGDGTDYVRLPLMTFPLSWVVQHKTLLSYPSSHAGTDKPAFSLEELAELKALAKKFLPNIKLECMLACPITKGADGDCVAVLLIINKHNASGPFEPWVSKSALALSSKWGARLAVTLHDEVANRQLGKLKTTNLQVPGLLMRQSQLQVMSAIRRFVKEVVSCDDCWVLLADTRKAHRDKLTLYSRQSAGDLVVRAGDAGCAGKAFMHDETIVCQQDDSWLSRKVGSKIFSAVAVVVHAPRDEAPSEEGADGVKEGRLRTGDARVGGSRQSSMRAMPKASVTPSGFLMAQPMAVVVALNKLGRVAEFSPSDAQGLEQMAGIVARVLDTNASLRQLADLQKEMHVQSEQRNLIVERAARLHHGNLLSNLSTPTGLLTRVTDMAKSVLGASQCAVFLSAQGGLKMYEMQQDFSAHAFLEDLGGIAGFTIKTGNTVLHSPDEPDANFDEQVDQRHVRLASQLVCVPLRDAANGVAGAVQVFRNASGGAFSTQDAELLQQLAKHLAFAVHNTALLTKMSQCNERLGAISPELPPKDTTPMLAQMTQRICSAERVNLFVRQGDEVASLTCFDEYSGRSIEIPLGQGFVGRCAEHKEATVVQQMLKDTHFNPNVDQRHGITIQDALYVPICSSAGYTSVVVEMLNKMSGAFDKTDETIAHMVGTHAHASIHRAHELQRLEEARTQALSLLTSVQYLYPYTGGTSDILHGAVAQLSIVMQATARIFLAVFNEEGQEMDDLWKCYDKSSGSPTMMSIEGVAGSCYRNVTPVRLNSAQVVDTAAHDDAEQGATQTSAFLCQPIMDNVSNRAIGVVEFRRAQQVSSPDPPPIQQFSDFEEELANQIAALCVHSMVHHSKTWSVKQAAEALRAQGFDKNGVKFPD